MPFLQENRYNWGSKFTPFFCENVVWAIGQAGGQVGKQSDRQSAADIFPSLQLTSLQVYSRSLQVYSQYLSKFTADISPSLQSISLQVYSKYLSLQPISLQVYSRSLSQSTADISPSLQLISWHASNKTWIGNESEVGKQSILMDFYYLVV